MPDLRRDFRVVDVSCQLKADTVYTVSAFIIKIMALLT